jgi:branched-chain amino acid transport system permease protein
MYCGVVSLTMLTGFTGQLSGGHGVFMGVGAYTTAVLTPMMVNAGIDGFLAFLLSAVAGAVFSLLLGWLIGIATAQMSGPYLAGVTLALVLLVSSVTTIFSGVLGGEIGVSMAPVLLPGGLGNLFSLEQGQLLYSVVIAGIITIVLANIVASRTGRVWRALRDDDVAAELSGIKVRSEKARSFALSTTVAAIGGSLLVSIVGSATPTAYAFFLSLQLLAAMVLGGMGSLLGAFLGAVMVVLVPDLLSIIIGGIPLDPAMANRLTGNLPLGLFGVAVVIVLLLAPQGLASLFTKIGRFARSKRRPKVRPSVEA